MPAQHKDGHWHTRTPLRQARRTAVALAVVVMAGSATLLSGLALVDLVEPPRAAEASPWGPPDGSNDPRNPANCPGGYADVLAPLGESDWCRGHGLNLQTTSGTGTSWFGQYVLLIDFQDGVGPQVTYAWCEDFAATHPKVQYPAGVLMDGKNLAEVLHGPLAHEELADAIVASMALTNDATVGRAIPGGSGTVYSADVAAAAIGALVHWVIGDRSKNTNTIVVSDIDDPFAGASGDVVEAMIQELIAYTLLIRNEKVTVDIVEPSVQPTMHVTVAQTTDNGPLPDEIVYGAEITGSTNLRYADGTPVQNEFLSVANPNVHYAPGTGTFTLDVAPIDPNLGVSLSARREWQSAASWAGLPAGQGQQSTALYLRARNQFLTSQDSADPDLRHVRIIKSSSDPYLHVDGITFQLIDANGAGKVVAEGVIAEGPDGTGVVDFFNINVWNVAPPLVVHELPSDTGLAVAPDVTLPWPLSSNQVTPTLQTVLDVPTNHALIIRKETVPAEVRPGDRAGFSFSVVREDGADFGLHGTKADGSTEVIQLSAGTFNVCEVSVPTWWPGAPPVACQSVVIAKSASAISVVTFVWTNVAPAVSCRTTATDQGDGDHILADLGGTVVDVVHCDGLIAGTTYAIDGELQSVINGTATPTGITAHADAIAGAVSQDFVVSYTVPAGQRCARLVAFETVKIGDAVVASHADINDEAQTVRIPSISTHATSGDGGKLVRAGEAMHDAVDYCGLPPGDYTFTATWQQAKSTPSTASECTPTQLTGTATVHVDAGSATGTAVTSPVTVPDGDAAVFVAYETVVNGSGATVATHQDCTDRQQTLWRPTLQTQRVEADPVGPGTNHDIVQVSGLPPADVTAGYVWSIEGALHVHPSGDMASWTCDSNNGTSRFTIGVTKGDGEYRSPGESHEPGNSYSYEETLVITPDGSSPSGGGTDGKQVEVVGDSGSWRSVAHGCRVPTQSFRSRHTESEQTYPTPPPPPPITLPKTGASGTSSLVTDAAATAAVGVVLVSLRLVRRKRTG